MQTITENNMGQSAGRKIFSSQSQGEDFNFTRKIFHLIGLVIPATYFFNLFELFPHSGVFLFKEATRSISFFMLAGIVTAMLIVEILRFSSEWWQNLFMGTVGRLLKEKEALKPHGALPFMAANAIVIGFFPKDIAMISIFFLNFGDPCAAYFGGKFGRVRLLYNGKSLIGALAGMVASFLSGAALMAIISYFPAVLPDATLPLWQGGVLLGNSLVVIGAGAILGFIFELFSGDGIIDDNWTVPVGSGAVMCLTLALIHRLPATFYFNHWRDLMVPLL